MKLSSTPIAAMLAALAAASCANPDNAKFADSVYVGGVIYTNDADRSVAEAVAVKDGRIEAVGAAADINALKGLATEIINLNGAAMYPGFVDGHAHLLGIGMRELTLNLDEVSSVAELARTVAAAVEKTPAGETLYGRGWIETHWPEARFPTRADLDPVSAGRAVVLSRADGHAVVANSLALERAGIDRTTADPPGGRIEKDAAGEPTGMLIDNAQGLVERLVAAPSEGKRREAFAVASKVYAARGWAGIYNVSVDPADVALIEERAAANDVRIRVFNAVDKSGYGLVEGGPRIDPTGRVVTRAIKLYADGALGSRGAALSEPYADRPETRGLLLTSHEEMAPLLAQALKDGVQIATHAIGDEANRLVLDWYEEAFAAVPPEDRKVAEPRWRIEHAQILHTEDIARFKADRVIASMQPSHAIGDLYFAPARLGDARLDGAYAWRSLLDAGAMIAAGSDAPVEKGDPLIEFYAAVARKDLGGNSRPDWRPAEKVTREEALAMLTSANAYAAFAETEIGSIEPGKKADLTVFSKDIMTVPEAEILSARPLMTVVDGVVIFRAAE